ncbi:MAG: NTP transferase domain-containing protein, partial [Actinobacteria bacterium]|nr:NTP transferase domain-containing protein [Actinomycetota bacterium]
MIAGLVLAAGAGARFGGRKQLAELDGRPLLEHVLAAMAEAPLDRVCVVLGSGASDVIAGVDLHGAEAVVCARWEDGQSASVRAGVEALAGADAVVVALGDQPFLSPRAVERVIAARDGEADAV